jgi:hypothetical protein
MVDFPAMFECRVNSFNRHELGFTDLWILMTFTYIYQHDLWNITSNIRQFWCGFSAANNVVEHHFS